MKTTSILKSGAAMFVGAMFVVSSAAFAADPTVVEIAISSPDHTTLVAAVQAAGLVDTLNSAGPFTVFAPVNSGFAALPAGTVDTLLMPENKDMLTKVLTAHVVAGEINAATLIEAINANGGRYEFVTVSGDALAAEIRGGNVYLADENGGVSKVVATDLEASNGVVHVVSNVLVPK